MFKRLSSVAILVALLLIPVKASAANISSIGVSGSTVTVVTASAHGLAVNTGVCLSLTPVCAVVKAVTNSTTFTFDMPTNVTVAPCASSCGTGDLAPKLAVLQVQANQSTKTFSYVMWLTTLTPLPRTGATSAWTATAVSGGASAAENNALAAGSYIEVVRSVTFPSSLPIADVQTYMQNDYTATQAALAANTQPGTYYGFTWNGAAWVQQ